MTVIFAIYLISLMSTNESLSLALPGYLIVLPIVFADTLLSYASNGGLRLQSGWFDPNIYGYIFIVVSYFIVGSLIGFVYEKIARSSHQTPA